jgi:hypothetical protein
MSIRPFRIAGIGAGITYLFQLSRSAGIARGQEEPAGMLWAIGVLTVLFSVRAFVTEKTAGPEQDRQKDFLWGLAIGCSLTMLIRLIGLV